MTTCAPTTVCPVCGDMIVVLDRNGSNFSCIDIKQYDLLQIHTHNKEDYDVYIYISQKCSRILDYSLD